MKVPQSVAVVGGGFSGAMTVVQLIRQGYRGSVILFERHEAIARGVAYGTTCDRHLLNVPAGAMSALPDDAGNFLHWLEKCLPGSTAATFAPRRVYGDYIQELLRQAIEIASGRVRVINEEVVACIPTSSGAWQLTTQTNCSYVAEVVVLATGHARPQPPIELDPNLERSGKFMTNPWQAGLLQGLDEKKPILLIGSGLTAADVVLEAQAGGFKGDIYILSRRGFLPRVHALAFKPAAAPVVRAHHGSARALLRALREVIDAGHENWRSAIDSLRPETQALWKALGSVEQRRFLRHIRPYWEVHRHRVAPEVAAELESLVHEGRLHRLSGRLEAVELSGSEVRVRYISRAKGESKEIVVQRVINCTGPANLALSSSALIQQLLGDGFCRLDELRIGFDVDAQGRAIAANGEVHESLLTIGSLRKGALWETTAVRELREQAKSVAERVMEFSNVRTAA